MGTLKQASKILSIFEDTSTDQIQVIIESGFLVDLRDFNIAGANRDDFRRLGGLKPLNPPLVESIGTITILATTERFTARDHFVIDNTGNARVKIAYLDSNFKNWFLGKTEAPAPEAMIKYGKLNRRAFDDEIRKEIGAEHEETTLAQIFALMKCQPNGKPGVLLTNGYANIFYVRDIKGAFWAMDVGWYSVDEGWGVYASSVSYPNGWGDGYQVFSQVA